MSERYVLSGLPPLDSILDRIRLGDNVVWQVDSIEDYCRFARPFAGQSLRDGRRLVYVRFAPHEPILLETPGLEIIEVDPAPGFDTFSGEVHDLIGARGREAFYVFDNLSALVEEWATDELLANFFQVTCPFLFELDTVAYFALTRGQHAHGAVARIRDTTQLLIDVYHVDGDLYIHPLKVWDRYSSDMFLPHRAEGAAWAPVHRSSEAAAVKSRASHQPLRPESGQIAPWDTVHRKLLAYRGIDHHAANLGPEIMALRQESAHMMLGSQPEFDRLVDRYLSLDDLFQIRDRLIGSGRIGGKAAGMLVARAILSKAEGHPELARAMDAHDSFYIGSDVFFTFLVQNNLFRQRLKLSRSSHSTREEFARLEERFLEGQFAEHVLAQFRSMLEYFGQAPIIVRSSSLLEDSFGNAFAGKYRSEFCVNQGTPETRLADFERAVKLVYASALNPDALSYRRRRGLGERDEQMAILVQRVSGEQFKGYFFPALAGVAFSKNLYAWTDRIDAEQGMLRLVFGLGTLAVDRVGGDYPRMIAVSHPGLRPEVGAEIAKYSQRTVDVLDLRNNRFVNLRLADLLAEKDYPNLYLFVSEIKDGHVADPFSNRLGSPSSRLVLTFGNLLKRTGFVGLLGSMVSELEKAYGHAVDTEFTASVDSTGQLKVNVLQCRPLWLPGAVGVPEMPADLAPERVLFRSSKMISGGVLRGLRYVLYIDPVWYAGVSDLSVKKSIGRMVGRINDCPQVEEAKILMMGPGRWGSSNIDLGVNVGYAEIDNARVLVEMAREEHGHVPEVSYGTHFFQDLVEAQVVYLPLFPDEEAAQFNESFFRTSPNVLTELLPHAHAFEHLIKVIDVKTATRGLCATVMADPGKRKAVCFLEESPEPPPSAGAEPDGDPHS